MSNIIKHKFEVMSVKTANKDGQKYLSKNGDQAYRVSVKIGEEWYGNMIWEEPFLPKKGQEYNIELSENDGFKNWDYKLLTKKEQMEDAVSSSSHINTHEQPTPPPPTQEVYNEQPKDDVQARIIRGMSGNQSATLLSVWAKDKDLNDIVDSWEKLRAILIEKNNE